MNMDFVSDIIHRCDSCVTSGPFVTLVVSSAEKNALMTEDLPRIRKADLENHNRDGGLWLVIHGRVYDVDAFKADAPCGTECLTQYTGTH